MSKVFYKELPIQGSLESNNLIYLDRLLNTIDLALAEYPRTFAMRVDLRLPDICDDNDDINQVKLISYPTNGANLMSRFIESLSAKIKAQGVRMRKEGKRVYPCTVRYAWVKERATAVNDHYHLVLFFNKDRFHKAGNYKRDGSLAGMIIGAWASALKSDVDDVRGLPYFPSYHGYYINKNSQGYVQQYRDIFYRVSFMAKKRTKHYGEGSRCFGCSSR